LEIANLMSDDEKHEMVRLRFTWTDHASKNLSKRIEEFRRGSGDFEFDDVTAAIHFLRGTAARAGFALPALYQALGAGSLPDDPDRPHWQAVQAVALEQSALHTIALACRAIFDGGTRGLRGGLVAQPEEVGGGDPGPQVSQTAVCEVRSA
jgi:hypothetical protein